jgi:hypothetical protein
MNRDLSVYNMLLRLTTSFDHNSDGKLDFTSGQIRETGTFLKAISILPYIRNLGVNTIYLLPVTSIGIDEKKGNLGSPYAIRNPYLPDENLSEPLLDLNIETEFRAFAEAVHLLDMKLVCEFVFRTASVDSDLSLEHPEWFYWINNRVKNRTSSEISEAKYGPPIFLKKELEKINEIVEAGNFEDLPAPHEQHIKMFTEPPKKVARVESKIRGLLSDKKTEVRIPGAFADWPPNDKQPAWSDVTYLKLYDNDKFNYIAYNTVRMYDKKLAKSEYVVKDLWDYIVGIIPHYITEYNLDGVMIDMGHALPSELRKLISNTALKQKPDFFFWEENFSINSQSKEEGYDAVLGYLPFDAHRADKMKDLIYRFYNKDIPVNFFATSETHNTPRSFQRIPESDYLKIVYTISLFSPAITFIHSGFELAESNPVNTGLDFTPEEIEKFPSEKLGLFSSVQLNWENQNEITDFIKKVNKIKLDWISENDDIFKQQIFPINTGNDAVIGFLRRDSVKQEEILILANLSNNFIENSKIELLEGACGVTELISDVNIPANDGNLYLTFSPYNLKICRMKFSNCS